MAEFTHADIHFWSVPLLIFDLDKNKPFILILATLPFVTSHWVCHQREQLKELFPLLGLSPCLAHLTDYLSRISGTEWWNAAQQHCSLAWYSWDSSVFCRTLAMRENTKRNLFCNFVHFFLLRQSCWRNVFLNVYGWLHLIKCFIHFRKD